MKNKVVSLIVLPLVLPALFSCNSRGKKPIEIPYGQKYDSSLKTSENLTEIEYGLLESFIDAKRTFILMVQGTESDCVCYADFLNSLSNWMKEESARVYHIKKDDLIEKKGIRVQSNANSVAIFNKGVLKKQFLFKDMDPIVTDKKAFSDKLNSMVSINQYCFYLDKRQLDLLYSSDYAGFTVLFGRESCSDCRYLYSSFLDDFTSNIKSPLYLFNVDEIRKLGDEQYDAFKDEYGLSSLNSEYGYTTGVVPTFQYVVPAKGISKAEMVKDAAVYLNDHIALQLLSKNYVVTGTYWDGSRYHEFLDGSNIESNLLKKVVPEEETIDGRWKNEAAAKYHNPLIEAFLRFYLETK